MCTCTCTFNYIVDLDLPVDLESTHKKRRLARSSVGKLGVGDWYRPLMQK